MFRVFHNLPKVIVDPPRKSRRHGSLLHNSPSSQHASLSFVTHPTTPTHSTSASVAHPAHPAALTLHKHSALSWSVSRCYYSNKPQKGNTGFFGRIIENVKQDEDPAKKKLRESMERLQKDYDNITQSEAAQKARDQYQKIESETAEGAEKARKKIGELKQSAKDSEVFKKAGENMQKMGENLSSQGERIAKTEAYQKFSHGAGVVKDEIDATLLKGSGLKVYKAPAKLRLRSERNLEAEQRIVEANPNAQDVVLHKNSRIMDTWNNFKDNNKYVNNLMGLKTKLDESDNTFVRASYELTDRFTNLFSGMFANSVSQVLTEVTKVDPKFDIDMFLLDLEYDIIPNVLEAIIRPDLKILKDWTFERIHAQVSEQHKAMKTLGQRETARILDIDNLELVEGVMADEGPMLLFRFRAQMIHFIRNHEGKIIEGAPDKVIMRNHVWVMIRDQEDFNPKSAWKLLELQVSE